jgi:hypothetical protein
LPISSFGPYDLVASLVRALGLLTMQGTCQFLSILVADPGATIMDSSRVLLFEYELTRRRSAIEAPTYMLFLTQSVTLLISSVSLNVARNSLSWRIENVSEKDPLMIHGSTDPYLLRINSGSATFFGRGVVSKIGNLSLRVE